MHSFNHSSRDYRIGPSQTQVTQHDTDEDSPSGKLGQELVGAQMYDQPKVLELRI